MSKECPETYYLLNVLELGNREWDYFYFRLASNDDSVWRKMLKVGSDSCAKSTTADADKNVVDCSWEIFEDFDGDRGLSFDNSIVIVWVNVRWIRFFAVLACGSRAFIESVSNQTDFNVGSAPTFNTAKFNAWSIDWHEDYTFNFHKIAWVRDSLCVVTCARTHDTTLFLFLSKRCEFIVSSSQFKRTHDLLIFAFQIHVRAVLLTQDHWLG